MTAYLALVLVGFVAFIATLGWVWCGPDEAEPGEPQSWDSGRLPPRGASGRPDGAHHPKLCDDRGNVLQSRNRRSGQRAPGP